MDGILENRKNINYQNKNNNKINKKKIITRGKSKRFKETELCIISANAAQLKCKMGTI